MPSIPATIDAKAAPQVADWMPNQPMHAIARIRLMTYFEPFSQRAGRHDGYRKACIAGLHSNTDHIGADQAVTDQDRHHNLSDGQAAL